MTSDGDDASESSCTAEWSAPDRRLTRFELAYAVEDVFGVDASSLHSLPAPRRSIGERPAILVGRMLDVSDAFLEPYAVALATLSDEAAGRLVTNCSGASLEPCLRSRLWDGAHRLWRRPLSTAEQTELEQILEAETEPRERVGDAVEWLLGSPNFYQRSPVDGRGGALAAQRRFASRLALTLWSSVPDAELMATAEGGRLREPRVLETQLERMMADARFRRFTKEFSRQWLELDRPALFRSALDVRDWVEDPDYAQAVHEQLVDWLITRLDRPVAELLLDESSDDGLLLSPALLGALSSPIEGGGNENWLGRGLVVQSAFLCRDFPLASAYPRVLWSGHWLIDPPHPNAPRPGEREMFEARNHDEPCLHCHRQLETIGAALYEYDGFGQPLHDAREPARLPAAPGLGPEALRDWILSNGRFETCVAQKLSSYVLSRSVSALRRDGDACDLSELTSAARERNTLRQWLVQLLTRDESVDPVGQRVVENPKPMSDVSTYVEPVTLSDADDASCADFDAQRFLVESCGSGACHGPGSIAGVLVAHDEATTRRLLLEATPLRDGYCSDYDGYVDPEEPERSLLLRKVLGGDACGAPMPLAGGPRSLNRERLACFARWTTELGSAQRD